MVGTTRTTVGGALLALVVSGICVAPASADRDDPPGDDRGILEHEVPVDMAVNGNVVYPALDNYRDILTIRVFESPPTDERMKSVDFEVVDGAGEIVYAQEGDYHDLYALGQFGETKFYWNGRRPVDDDDPYGEWVTNPEGIYTLTVRVVDSSNDRLVLTKDVEVNHAKLQWRTWRKTFRAADTMIEKHVGRCATLLRPARRGWAGSFGYRSRCRDGKRSVVSTVHGINMQNAFRDWYSSVRLSMYGGHARGSARSRLQYFYLSKDGRWMHTLRGFGPELGTHRGFLGGGRRYVLGKRSDEPPHFIWSVGLGGGQAYDVKSFTVTTVRKVLR